MNSQKVMIQSLPHSDKAYNLLAVPLFGLVGLSVFLSYLNMKDMAFLCIVVFVLLLLTSAMRGIPYLYIQRITNTLVYLHVFSLFLPWGGDRISFLPSGPKLTIVLMTFLLITVFIFILHQRIRQNKISLAFKFLVFWSIFSIITGILDGIMGYNPIRANLPLVEQLKGMSYITDAFIVYYVIVKNDWQFEEFEKLFRIVLLGGIIISLECLFTFYAGIQISRFSINYLGAFNSMFIGRFYYPGIIGISISFLSIYFWRKYRKNGIWYLIIFFLGSFLTFSTLSRSMMGSYVSGMVFFLLLSLMYSWHLTRRDSMIKPCFVIIGFIIVSSMLFGLVEVAVKKRPDILSSNAIWGRGYRYMRAVDVLYQHGLLGTGFGIARYYSHSSSVHPVVSRYISPYTSDYYSRNMIHSPLLLRENKAAFLTESIHSLSFDFILALGLVGLFFITYLIFHGWKIFRFIINFAKKHRRKYRLSPVFAICALILSVCMGVQTTSKFESYWYFAILFSFINFMYKELKTNPRTTLSN